MEENIPCKRNQKKAEVEMLVLDEIDLKEYYKIWGRILHNDQRINPRRRYNNCKCIYIQHRSTTVYIKQMLTDIKWEIDSNTIIQGI